MAAAEEERPKGRIRAIKAWGRSISERTRDGLEYRSTRARQAIPALDLVWEFFHRFRKNNGTVLVGHLAYRMFVWLAPLMLVLAAGLGFSTSTFDIVEYAQEMGVAAETAEDAVAQAETSRVTALVIGVPALVFASWSLVRAAHYAHSQVWGIEIEKAKGSVRLAFSTVLFAVAVAIVSLAVAFVQRQGPLLALAGWAGGFVLTTAALWVVQWTMPRRTDRWSELLPGPVFAALGLSLLHAFAAVYLPGRVQSASVLYGSIGVAIAILFYVFLMAYLLVICPFVNAVWVDRAEILGGRPWVNDPDAAPSWARGPLRRFSLAKHRPPEPSGETPSDVS